ncbi:MAG: hypothetical protein AAGI89_03060 [Pseudomonadota bacterium]
MTAGKRSTTNMAYNDHKVENVAQAVLTLSYEVWALRDRVNTLEEVLKEKGVPVTEAIDQRVLTDEQQARRDEEVKAFAGRIIAALSGIPPENPDV